jgi:hypothetical protein
MKFCHISHANYIRHAGHESHIRNSIKANYVNSVSQIIAVVQWKHYNRFR